MNVSVFIRHILHEGEVPGAGGRSRSHARGTALADGAENHRCPPPRPAGRLEGGNTGQSGLGAGCATRGEGLTQGTAPSAPRPAGNTSAHPSPCGVTHAWRDGPTQRRRPSRACLADGTVERGRRAPRSQSGGAGSYSGPPEPAWDPRWPGCNRVASGQRAFSPWVSSPFPFQSDSQVALLAALDPRTLH